MILEIQNPSTGVYVDITPYIAFNGLEYQLSDVDSPDAGRTLDGVMHRGKISDKDKWKIKFRALTTDEASILIPLVCRETFVCHYLSPRYGGMVYKTMYAGDRNASHCIEREDGTILWKDLAFNIIEV